MLLVASLPCIHSLIDLPLQASAAAIRMSVCARAQRLGVGRGAWMMTSGSRTKSARAATAAASVSASTSTSTPTTSTRAGTHRQQAHQHAAVQAVPPAHTRVPVATAAAAARPALTWHPLCSTTELRCDLSLTNGQCFHWVIASSLEVDETHDDDQQQQQQQHQDDASTWYGVLDHFVVGVRQLPGATSVEFCQVHPKPNSDLDASAASALLHDRLRAFLRLDDNRFQLARLYADWSARDARFAKVSLFFPGVRLFKQDPYECLLSFLCSSNNNIARITSMLQSLRTTYGEHLVTYRGRAFHAFPTLEQLRSVRDEDLRALGFGYRAPFLVSTVQRLIELGGAAYLQMLIASAPSVTSAEGAVEAAPIVTRDAVETALCAFDGVGPKVASCVALFCLDRLDCIPIDTHVWQIAVRDYGEHFPSDLASKSITKKMHGFIGDFFRTKFGEYAGWAHTVLFCADLAQYQHLITDAALKAKRVTKAGGGADTVEVGGLLTATTMKEKKRKAEDSASAAWSSSAVKKKLSKAGESEKGRSVNGTAVNDSPSGASARRRIPKKL